MNPPCAILRCAANDGAMRRSACGASRTSSGKGRRILAAYRSSRKYGSPSDAGGCLSLLLRMLVKISTITVIT